MAGAISLSLFFAWVGIFFAICFFVKNRVFLVLPVFLSFPVGYNVHMECTLLYWDLSFKFASNQAETDRVVFSDGANLVFTRMLFAPASAVLVSCVGIAICFFRAQQRFDGFEHVKNPTTYSGETKDDGNPYNPPSQM